MAYVHKLEELALRCLTGERQASAALLSRLRLRRGNEGFCPTAAILMVGGAWSLAHELSRAGFEKPMVAAAALWQTCQEIAEGRLQLDRCSLRKLSSLPGWSRRAAKQFVLEREKLQKTASL